MTASLALKYRPQTFSDMIGQRLNAVVLQQMVDTKSVPSGILFSGPSGVGKTTAARILANELGASDTIEIDAASNGGVAEVRKLIDSLRYSTGGEYRVVILDEAQSITRQGFEAFLKVIEEPPAGTIFVLVTTEPFSIPNTIISRLMEFQFRAVTASDVLERLVVVSQKESISITPELLHYLAQKSDGNVRTGLTILDQARRAGITTVAEFVELSGEHDPAPALLAALSTGDPANFFAVLDQQLATVGDPAQISADLTACIRDLMIIRAGGVLSVTGASYESRRELALRLEQERLLAAIRVLWELKTRIRRTEDPRGNLELALILISEAFSRGKNLPSASASQPAPAPHVQAPAEVNSVPPKKLSLADLQRSR